MNKTKIIWTDKSLNPVTGCSHAGTPECDHCYARVMAKRLKAMGILKYSQGFTPAMHPDVIAQQLKDAANKRKITSCFLVSMGDLFHSAVTDSFIDDVMAMVELTPKVVYQVLTKRAERMELYFSTHKVPANLWVGVTCGHPQSLPRIENLRRIAAPVRFISAEPLLDDIVAAGLNLNGVDWVIVGGESGKCARQMQESWVLSVKQLADASGTAFFFKQVGSVGFDGKRRSAKANGDLLQGKQYHNYPTPRINY